MDEPAQGPFGGRPRRADLFSYLHSAETANDYRAILSLFTGPVLVDLSAVEVANLLAERGISMSIDQATIRCEQLQGWGNLVRGVRDARVPTVRDFLRSRSRYQVSKLGGRVHRDVEAVLAAGEGAQEVARELLGATVQVLNRIGQALLDSAPDADGLAADVTTVFNNQRLFTSSVRDFYAYLNTVLLRYDLAGAEYHHFKELLLEYIDLITADVSRHAPAVVARCESLRPRLPRLLEILDSLPVPISADGVPVERLPGRSLSDWDQLQSWYSGNTGRSGPDALRSAAERALRQLLANAKRMLAAAGTAVSRRSDMVTLASWFNDADPASAHRLFAAVFGAYPARHLFGGSDEPDSRDGANTSWWDATPVEVPLSLRDRGDRTARGRTSAVPDPGLDRELLASQADRESQARAAAAGELVAAGRLHDAEVSPAARDLLLDLVAGLLAAYQELTGPVEWVSSDLQVVLFAEPEIGARTTLTAADGAITVHDLKLSVRRWEQDRQQPGRTG